MWSTNKQTHLNLKFLVQARSHATITQVVDPSHNLYNPIQKFRAGSYESSLPQIKCQLGTQAGFWGYGPSPLDSLKAPLLPHRC